MMKQSIVERLIMKLLLRIITMIIYITGIVGWKAEDDECISDRYLAFESKYAL